MCRFVHVVIVTIFFFYFISSFFVSRSRYIFFPMWLLFSQKVINQCKMLSFSLCFDLFVFSIYSSNSVAFAAFYANPKIYFSQAILKLKSNPYLQWKISVSFTYYLLFGCIFLLFVNMFTYSCINIYFIAVGFLFAFQFLEQFFFA